MSGGLPVRYGTAFAMVFALLVVAACDWGGGAASKPSPSWPTAPHPTSPQTPLSRVDDHIGGYVSKDRYVRSPWDRYVLEVETRPDPEHRYKESRRCRIRTYTPRSPVRGDLGPVVFTDPLWFGEDGMMCVWSATTDQAWLASAVSRYNGGRPQVRSVTLGADGRWEVREHGPESANEFPPRIREMLDRTVITADPRWPSPSPSPSSGATSVPPGAAPSVSGTGAGSPT